MKKRRKSRHSKKVPPASGASRGRSCHNDHNSAHGLRDIIGEAENHLREDESRSIRGRKKTRQGHADDRVSSVTKACQALSSFLCCCRASKGQRKQRRKTSNKSAEVCICSSDDDDEKSPRIRVVNRRLSVNKETEPIKASDPKNKFINSYALQEANRRKELIKPSLGMLSLIEQIEFIHQGSNIKASGSKTSLSVLDINEQSISSTSQVVESSTVQLKETENLKSISYSSNSARDNKNVTVLQTPTTCQEDINRFTKENTSNEIQTKVVTGRFGDICKDLRPASSSKAVARVDYAQMLTPAELSELDNLANQIVENVLSSGIQMFYSSLIPVNPSIRNSSAHGIERNPTNDVEVEVPVENPNVMLREEELAAIDILATEIVENALSSGIQIYCSTAFSEKSMVVTAREVHLEETSPSTTLALLSLTEVGVSDNISDIPSSQNAIVQPVLESLIETATPKESFTIPQASSTVDSQTIVAEDSHPMSRKEDIADIETLVQELIDDVLNMPMFSSFTAADELPISKKETMECVSLGLGPSKVSVVHAIETNPRDVIQSVATSEEQRAANSTLMTEELTDMEAFAKEFVEDIISSSIQMFGANTVADKLKPVPPKQIEREETPLPLSPTLESLADDVISLDTDSDIQTCQNTFLRAAADSDPANLQLIGTPVEQVSTLPIVPAVELQTGHFADIGLLAKQIVKDVMSSSFEMFLSATVSDSIAITTPQAANLNKKMLTMSCVVESTRYASMLVTVPSVPSSRRTNLSAIEGNITGKLPHTAIAEGLDSTFPATSSSRTDADQVWEANSILELDKLAELEVNDLLTKATISNNGKRNACATEIVGSGNSSTMPPDKILEKERGPTPSSGLLSFSEIEKVEIDPNTPLLSISSTECTDENRSKPCPLSVESNEWSPVLPKTSESDVKYPDYDDLCAISNDMNAAMEILPGHTETSESKMMSLTKNVANDAELLQNIESSKDEKLLSSSLMDIPLEYAQDALHVNKHGFDASTFQQSVSAKKTVSMVDNNQIDIESVKVFSTGSKHEVDQTQQIPDMDLYKPNHDRKDVVKSQITGLNGHQTSLPSQYPTVAELDVMLLFIKAFKDLILALRNEHSKVNPIHEKRKKDIKLKRKRNSRTNDMEHNTEKSKGSKPNQSEKFSHFGLQTVSENGATSTYLLKCKEMNEMINNLRCKANKTKMDKLSHADICKKPKSGRDGTCCNELDIENLTPGSDVHQNCLQLCHLNEESFDTMYEELTDALAELSSKLMADDTDVEENEIGKFSKTKTNSKTRRGRSPTRKSESSVRYGRGRCPQKAAVNPRNERSRSPSIHVINTRFTASRGPRRKIEYHAENAQQVDGKSRYWEPDDDQKPERGYVAKVEGNTVIQCLTRCKELAEEIMILCKKTRARFHADGELRTTETGKHNSDDATEMNTSVVKKKDKWKMRNENSQKMTEQTVRIPEKVRRILEDREVRVSSESTLKQEAKKIDKALHEGEEMEKERIEIEKSSEETTDKLDNKNMRKAEKLVENPLGSILVINEAKKQ